MRPSACICSFLFAVIRTFLSWTLGVYNPSGMDRNWWCGPPNESTVPTPNITCTHSVANWQLSPFLQLAAQSNLSQRLPPSPFSTCTWQAEVCFYGNGSGAARSFCQGLTLNNLSASKKHQNRPCLSKEFPREDSPPNPVTEVWSKAVHVMITCIPLLVQNRIHILAAPHEIAVSTDLLNM